MKLTICVLCFGDYPHLARRCLGSIAGALRAGYRHVTNIRIGLNYCVEETEQFVREWSREVTDEFGTPIYLYKTAENVCKYPLMRKMLYGPGPKKGLPEAVMWFDDDSYFDDYPQDGPKWWDAMFAELEQADMLGQMWLMPVQGNQLEWIKTQPWYNAKAGLPPKKDRRGNPCFEFCQGAWWVIRSSVLKGLNWPVPEIRHNGGDSMLGEALRHAGCRLRTFYGGVRINADSRGQHSKSKRRGRAENRVGWDYTPGKKYDLSHHDFDVEIIRFSQQPVASHLIDLYGDTHGA